jgi:hypothetical protein
MRQFTATRYPRCSRALVRETRGCGPLPRRSAAGEARGQDIGWYEGNYQSHVEDLKKRKGADQSPHPTARLDAAAHAPAP